MATRKLNNIRRKEEILKLRSEGKTYSEICDILGCSKSTVSYHCGTGTEKERVKSSVRERPAVIRKICAFRNRVCRKESVRSKTKTFKRASRKNDTHGLVNNINVSYTYQDVLDKIGPNPRCYLTGELIDLSKPHTYNFDHIIPVSKGGTNDLSNLAICTKDANIAKSNLSLDELKSLCKKILNFLDS